MNFEWTATITYFKIRDDPNDDKVGTEAYTIYAPTQHAAIEKAQELANKTGKHQDADYWLVDVE